MIIIYTFRFTPEISSVGQLPFLQPHDRIGSTNFTACLYLAWVFCSYYMFESISYAIYPVEPIFVLFYAY